MGFYAASGEGPKPWLDIKRIYKRKDPIFVISTVGRPVGDAHMINAVGRMAYLWADLEMMKVPGIRSVYCPPEAAGRFWAIVSAKITHPAGAERVAEAVSCSPTGHFGIKGIIVVDEDVAADDMAGVWWSLACRYDPGADTQIINKMRPTPFDPALPAGPKGRRFEDPDRRDHALRMGEKAAARRAGRDHDAECTGQMARLRVRRSLQAFGRRPPQMPTESALGLSHF